MTLCVVSLFYFHSQCRHLPMDKLLLNLLGEVCNGPEPNLVLWKCLFVSFCFHPFAMFFTFRFVPSSPIFLDVPFSFPCMPPGFSALLLDFCMNFCFAMILTFSRASIEP